MGGPSLQKIRWGTEALLSPQILENVITNWCIKREWAREKEKMRGQMRHQWPWLTCKQQYNRPLLNILLFSSKKQWVSRRPPLQISELGGRQKIFSSPQTLDQVYATGCLGGLNSPLGGLSPPNPLVLAPDNTLFRDSCGGEFGASHCNQWGFCCVVVQEQRTLPKLLWEDLFILVTSFITSSTSHPTPCAIHSINVSNLKLHPW